MEERKEEGLQLLPICAGDCYNLLTIPYNGPWLVDLRDAHHFHKSHIEGAASMPFFEEDLQSGEIIEGRATKKYKIDRKDKIEELKELINRRRAQGFVLTKVIFVLPQEATPPGIEWHDALEQALKTHIESRDRTISGLKEGLFYLSDFNEFKRVYHFCLVPTKVKVKPTRSHDVYNEYNSEDPIKEGSEEESEEEDELDFPDHTWPSEVVPGTLYLGDWESATDKHVLDSLGITSIVNCTKDDSHKLKDDPGIQYLQVPVNDYYSENIAVHFENAIAFIEEALQKDIKVLVHCHAGVSRSATIVMAYLIATNDWTVEQAFNYLKSKREIIGPNEGFMRHLDSYAQQKLTPKSNTTNS